MIPCRDCAYWKQTDVVQGECRKSEPRVFTYPKPAQFGNQMMVQMEVMGAWPPCKADQGCGAGLERIKNE